MGRHRLFLIRLLAVLIGTVLSVAAWSDARDLELDVQPLFESKSNPRFVIPYLVRASNRGPDARGSLVIQGSSFAMRYPLDLPSGSQKQLIVYPAEQPYSGNPQQFILQTNQGVLRFEQKPNYQAQTWLALAISDVSGVASFTTNTENYQSQITEAYAKPGRLPERAAGFIGCAVVLLGEGAERMSDTEVRALQDYVLLGGSVVMFGGPSTPILEDARWRSYLPIRPGKPKTISARGRGVLSLVPEGQFTITPGTPTPGSVVMHRYADEAFVVKKTIGLGRVVFIAANLFEEPGRTWEGTDDFFVELGLGSGGSELSSYFGESDYYGGAVTTYPASYSTAPGSPVGTLSDDPFQAKMPPTGTILMILAIYFVLVVPVNLLVLRKMGKGELAWVTSPVISLVFAAIFFQFAAGLYSAELSNATRGMWIVDEAASSGQFVGRSQLFFPRGGAYDLGLDRVEHVSSANQDYGNLGGGKLFGDLRATDDGQIRVRQMVVNNLSFHEFNLQQRMDGGSMVSLSSDGQTVRNLSKYTLENARLVVGGKVFKLGSLGPGSSVKRGGAAQPGFEDQIAMKRTTADRYAVLGEISGLRPGPQLGKIVPSYHRLTLMAYGVKGGGR